MTQTQEVKWEDVTFDELREGDEIEYVITEEFSQYRYWGTVGHKDGHSTYKVADWYLDSVADKKVARGVATLKRKVVEFEWPEKIGSCVETSKDGEIRHYVRVYEKGHLVVEWVHAETGDQFATWELELLTAGYRNTVISDGE